MLLVYCLPCDHVHPAYAPPPYYYAASYQLIPQVEVSEFSARHGPIMLGPHGTLYSWK